MNVEPDDDARLERGLHELLRPTGREQLELDRRVGRAAREHFAARRARSARHAGRASVRAWVLRAAAAVLVALGGWMLARTLGGGISTHDVAHLDFDGNGRVDVLDAFQVARGVARGATKPEWDVDGDGRVDREDANAIARAAVRVGS